MLERLILGMATLCLSVGVNAVDLSSKNVRFELSDRTGVLTSGELGGTKIFTESPDYYDWIVRDEALRTFSEREDQVKSMSRDTDWIQFVCCNPNLPRIRIVKQYTLQEDTLYKKVTFETDTDFDAVLAVHSVLAFTVEYRQGAYYQCLPGWDVRTWIKSEEITENFRIGNPAAFCAQQVLNMVRPDLGIGTAHYLWQLDGEYTFPSGSMTGMYTFYRANGWDFPAMLFFPKAGETRSFTTAYELYYGNHLNFYRRYAQRPEFRSQLPKHTPEWVKNLKFEAVCWRRNIPDLCERLNALLKVSSYTEDETAAVTVWGWAGWGEFPIETEGQVWVGANPDNLVAPAEMQKIIKQVREDYPQLKFGVYQMLTALMPGTENTHPDWVAFEADGKPSLMGTEPGWTPVFRMLCGEGVHNALLQGVSNVMDYYGLDFFYFDGGSSGGTRPDWRTHRNDRQSDWLSLWRELHAVVSPETSDRAMFCNSPIPFQSQIGYLELGRWTEGRWREVVDALAVAKLLQPPERYLSLLYRTHGVSNEPNFTNLLLAFAVRPGTAQDPNMYPDWQYLAAYLPWINAAYEIKDAVYVPELIVSPQWFAADAEICVTALQLGDSYLIAALNFGTATTQAEVQLDWNKIAQTQGVEWKKIPIQVKPSAIIKREAIPETLEQVVHQGQSSAVQFGDTLIFELQPNQLHYYLLTPDSAWITAINGKPTQFHLPKIGNARVKSTHFADGSMLVSAEMADCDSICVEIELPSKLGGEVRLIELTRKTPQITIEPK